MTNVQLQKDLENYGTKKSKKIYILLIILLAILSAGIYYFFVFKNEDKTKSTQYVTSKVKKGDLSVAVSATGILNPTNSVEIGIEVSGTIKDIFVDFVNGYSDHCHCLVSLGVDQSIQKVMQLIGFEPLK